MRLLALLVFAVAASAGAATPPALADAVASWTGHWTGTLTYRDYQPPHGRVVLPTVLDVTARASGRLRLTFTYDDGPHKTVHSVDSFVVSADGKTVTWVSEGDEPKPGDVFTVNEWIPERGRFVMNSKGEDDDKPALFRYTVVFTTRALTLTKETTSDGAGFAFRHEYAFQRP